jgi:hypothetical protein
LDEIPAALQKLLPAASQEGHLNFVMNLIGGTGYDKVSSMVHLGLAECQHLGLPAPRPWKQGFRGRIFGS